MRKQRHYSPLEVTDGNELANPAKEITEGLLGAATVVADVEAPPPDAIV